MPIKSMLIIIGQSHSYIYYDQGLEQEDHFVSTLDASLRVDKSASCIH